MLPLFVSRIICISAQFSASFNSHFLRSSFSLILTHFRHFCNFSSFCLETLTDTLTWQPALKDIFDIEIYNYLICVTCWGLKLLDIVKMRRKVDVSRRNVNEGFGDISQIAGPCWYPPASAVELKLCQTLWNWTTCQWLPSMLNCRFFIVIISFQITGKLWT